MSIVTIYSDYIQIYFQLFSTFFLLRCNFSGFISVGYESLFAELYSPTSKNVLHFAANVMADKTGGLKMSLQLPQYVVKISLTGLL